MKLGVLVLAVLIKLMGLFGVGVHQLSEFLEYIAVGMHSLLDLGGASSNVLHFPVHPRIVLPVRFNPSISKLMPSTLAVLNHVDADLPTPAS